MPSWAAFAPRISSLGRTIERIPTRLCCCSATKASPLNLRARSASTHVSPTAINLRPNIPQRNRELHDAFSALGRVAETYVDINRLQLALGGLAAQDAVTRVAVLGLDSQASAQRLVRLLLADPLGAEEQWEKELEKNGHEKAVLLKYGAEGDAQTPSPLYKVLSVPSRVLRSHNLELLVSTLNVNVTSNLAPSKSSKESVLVPKLQASARALPLPYPVHKALVFGEGLDSAIAFGRFSAGSIEDLGGMVKFAVDLPAPSEEADASTQTWSSAVSVNVGTKALATFRESIQNSVAYEHGWYRSGLPAISTWLTHDVGFGSTEQIKPVMKTLISSILDDTEANILKEDTAQLQNLTALPTSQDTSPTILKHVETWAEKSHTELRDELDAAFSSRNWHKLAWWKLFWRVDDVTMLSTEILERRWLVSAEKSSIYLAGRMDQAGYPDELQITAVNSTPEVPTDETANPQLDISTDVNKAMPWLQHIAAARTELVSDIVPPLQALAQRLILQTLSTTSLSSTLSALIYFSVPSFSIFEASAVGVLGLTFSLRRMQKLWEGARESWEGSVREEGRGVLKRTEETVRMIVEGKERAGRGVVSGEDGGVRERREAREAVERVRELLERVGRKEGGGV